MPAELLDFIIRIVQKARSEEKAGIVREGLEPIQERSIEVFQVCEGPRIIIECGRVKIAQVWKQFFELEARQDRDNSATNRR